MELSQDELAFAILTESHKVACKALFGSVVQSLNARYPHDWREKIFKSFTASTRPHIKRCLANNQPLTDFYAVCKLVRCHINEIADFCGGPLSDPRAKERLSLLIQGVNTARNWMFHGESVSVSEVSSSVGILQLVLTTFCCEPALIEYLANLRGAAKVVTLAQAPDREGKFPFSRCTVLTALLYTSFTSLERLFFQLFEYSAGNTSSSLREEDDKQTDVSALIKRITKEMCKPKKERMRAMEDRNSINELSDPTLQDHLKKIQTARNKFAHSEQLIYEDIKAAIGYIVDVLGAFGLKSEAAESALERVCAMDTPWPETSIEDGIESVVCSLRLRLGRLPDESSLHACDGLGQRILRPKTLHFVGRHQELKKITKTLTKSPKNTIVLLYGPAGVGKSYCATKLVATLRENFPRQAWLWSGTERDLLQDLSINEHLIHSLNASAKQPPANSQLSSGSSKAGCLLVLDDVSTSTVSLVLEKFVPLKNSLLLTTRSSAVKESLQRLLPCLSVVTLHAFTDAESWQLMKLKLKEKAECFSYTRRAVTEVLGNLPLCVSVYSSFLAHSTKNNNPQSLCDADRETILSNWRKIEQKFGDRFHISGLEGIVESAEIYLQDHPLVVLLLAKIFSLDSERILWDILTIEVDEENPYIVSWKANDSNAKTLFLNVLGVTDYLFSEKGRATLENCRAVLEELGLIGWDSVAHTVVIHRLILYSVQELMTKKSLFLTNLIAAVSGEPTVQESLAVKSTAGLVSDFLKAEFVLQAVARSLHILWVDTPEENILHDAAGRYKWKYEVYTFLTDVVQNLYPPKIKAGIQNYLEIRSEIVLALANFKYTASLGATEEEAHRWINVHEQYPVRPHEMGLWKLRIYELCARDLTDSKDQYLKSAVMYEEVLSQLDSTFKDQYQVASLHCQIAFANDLHCRTNHGVDYCRCGILARNMYLYEASKTCPILMTEPTLECIRRMMAELKKKHFFSAIARCFLVVDVWYHLILFQITTSFAENGTMDKTKECALQLIALCQQVQGHLLVDIEQDLVTDSGMFAFEKQFRNMKFLGNFTITEIILQRLVDAPHKGHCLRSLVYSQHAMEIITQTSNGGPQRDVYRHALVERTGSIVECCSMTAFGLGHYSLAKSATSNFGKLLDQLDSSWKSETKHSQETHQSSSCLTLICEGLFHVHIHRNFKVAIENFLMAVKTILPAELSASSLPIQDISFTWITVQYIACLCLFLDHDHSLSAEVLKVLKTSLDNDAVSISWRRIFRDMVRGLYISETLELHAFYMSFVELNTIIERKEFLLALKVALKCWKTSTDLPLTISEEFSKHVQSTLNDLWQSLFAQLAKHLAIIYSTGKAYSAAEWFLKFRIKLAKERRWSFLAAVYGIEYVEFLKEREQWSDAFEQCHIVHHDLVENFGDDYFKWLPDAPNAAHLCQTLQLAVANDIAIGCG